jgi:hypothetical protein
VSTSRAKRKQRRRARAGGRPADKGQAAAPDRVAQPRSDRAGAGDTAPAPAASARADRLARFEVRDGIARPQPIWAPFPLTELGMAAGIAIFAWGFLSAGERSLWLMSVAALLLAVVVGELCLREHFAGFRSHTLLLAALPVTAVHAGVFFAISDAWSGPLALATDLALGCALAWLLHRRFRAAHELARKA